MAKGPTVFMQKRITILLSIMVLIGFLGLLVRLFYLQVLGGEEYQQKAVAQQLRDTPISAKRGTIYDRNLTPLAQSATVWTVFMSPAYIKSEEQRVLIADKLSEMLGLDRDTLYEKTKKNTSFEYVKRKIEKPLADQVRKFCIENNITCISLEEDNKRYYPYGNFASTVLGFTGTDNQGLAGVEAYYDSYLAGTPGRVVAAKNAWGTDMPFKYEKLIEPKNGNSLVLTIDENIQHFAEKHLETAVVEQKVNNRAACIVINVNTGEILAMTTKGDFDLNSPFEIYDAKIKEKIATLSGDEKKAEFSKQQSAQWRNKAISDPYEPGSVFKIITAAGALEEGVVKADDHFHCPGYHKVGNRTIHCWKRTGHGSENFVDGIKNSCNPVFMQVGARLGGTKFFDYFSAFGLTAKTGMDLPGEATSIFHSKKTLENSVYLASTSMGQSFKVTPIQIVTAVSAAVNGGKLIQPHIVKQILDDEGNVIENVETKVKRQVISEETSKELALMLEKVVTEGSGKNAYIMGYRIGGKTGTSEKLDKKYEEGETKDKISSFLGFAPADDPQIACIVMMDEPRSGEIYGSVISAPVVGSIMADTLPYLGIEPKYTAEELEKLDVNVPNIVGKTPHMGDTALRKVGLTGKIVGKGEKVVAQVPSAGQPMPRGGTVIIYTEENHTDQLVAVPDVTNLTAAEVNKKLANAGLNPKLTGGGIDQSGCMSTKQNPVAGTMVKVGSVVTVTFTGKDEVE